MDRDTFVIKLTDFGPANLWEPGRWKVSCDLPGIRTRGRLATFKMRMSLTFAFIAIVCRFSESEVLAELTQGEIKDEESPCSNVF